MQCRKCGEQISDRFVFCPKCGAKNEPAATAVLNQNHQIYGMATPTVEKAKPHNTVLVVSIVCLTVICLAMTAIFTVLFLNREEDVPTPPSTHSEVVLSDDKTETPKFSPTETHTFSPTEIPDAEPTPVVNPTYRTIENTVYSYRCDIPTHFIPSGDTYSAPDGSAVMRIEARNNANGLTVDHVFNSYATEFGGEIHYSVKRDDWFALSIVSADGTHHYAKGFVDDYIRVFLFDSSGEALDVYRGYIEHIEDSFKRTDR